MRITIGTEVQRVKILQLTDLHVNAEGRRAFLRAESLRDLRRTVDYILQVDLQIDAVVVTGDVSTDGSISAYELVRRELLRLDCPFWVLPGNHDKKAEMKSVFADRCHTALDGVPGCCVDLEDARLLLLDSAVPGVSCGVLDERMLTWVAEQLNVPPQRPVMLWMHHFPFCTGYRGMDHPLAGEKELLALLQGHNAFVCSGHVHAGVVRREGDVTMLTCPAVSMLMNLRLDEVRFYTEQSGFALHIVEDGTVTTHLCAVPAVERAGGPYPFIE